MDKRPDGILPLRRFPSVGCDRQGARGTGGGQSVGRSLSLERRISTRGAITLNLYPAYFACMIRTSIAVRADTLEALNELKWAYRARSINDVIDLLICESEPDVYHDCISEDEPEFEDE